MCTSEKVCAVPGWQELNQKLLEVYFLFLFALGVSDTGRPPLRRLPTLFRNLLPLYSLLGFISPSNIAFTEYRLKSCRGRGMKMQHKAHQSLFHNCEHV